MSALDVKAWEARFPEVADVRPAVCPCCGAAGQPAGRPLVVVGHGVRVRMQLGPPAFGDEPEVGELRVRRYRCRACEAVLTVVPRRTAPQLRYRLIAVVAAMVAWSQGVGSPEVRRRFSPFGIEGAAGCRNWQALRRWTRAFATGLGLTLAGSLPQGAGMVVHHLAALAPIGTGHVATDALEGVAYFDGHRLRSPGGIPSTS